MANDIEVVPGGDGSNPVMDEELKRRLGGGQVENAFRDAESKTALSYLVDPGEEILRLMMRAYVPKENTGAIIRCLAMARHLAKCRRANNKSAEEEAMQVLALWTSAEGARAKMLVEAIVGERKFASEEGLANKFTKWALGNNAAGENKK